MIQSNSHPHVTMEVVTETDPAEIAAFRKSMECYARNRDWYQAHLDEIRTAHNHKHVYVAGQELFVGESVQEALSKAKAVHPDEIGSYYYAYVRREKVWKIYAHQRLLESRVRP